MWLISPAMLTRPPMLIRPTRPQKLIRLLRPSRQIKLIRLLIQKSAEVDELTRLIG
jgi:hypothetical protein